MTQSHTNQSHTTETAASPGTTTTPETRSEPLEATVERTVATLVRVGRLWAVYGLEAGRASLQATGETLQATSAILRDLSKRLDDRSDERHATPR